METGLDPSLPEMMKRKPEALDAIPPPPSRSGLGEMERFQMVGGVRGAGKDAAVGRVDRRRFLSLTALLLAGSARGGNAAVTLRPQTRPLGHPERATPGGGRTDGNALLFVYSDYEYGGFCARHEFDLSFKAAALAPARLPLAQFGARPLERYAAVIFSSMCLRRGGPAHNTLDLSRHGAALGRYLSAGGTVLLTDVAEDADGYSLAQVSPRLGVKLAASLTGLVGGYTAASPVCARPYPLDRLPGRELSYNPWAIGRRLGGTYTWAYFAEFGPGWSVLAKSPAGHPVMVAHAIGAGLLVATTLAAGRGIDAFFLTNLLFYACREHHLAFPGKVGLVMPRPRPAYQRNSRPFDPLGNALVGGKPFFPFGFYAVHPSSYPILAANGFNFVWGLADAAAAQKSGLHGIEVMSWDIRTAERELAAEAGAPAGVAVCLAEEPSNLPVPPFDSTYIKRERGLVGRVAPNLPTTVLVNNFLDFPAFGTIGDFGSCDPYCFKTPDSPATLPGAAIDRLRRFAGADNYPVWTILQAHWFGDKKKGKTFLAKPTADQLAAETYVALVHRVNGIVYFVFDEDNQHPNDSITYIHRANGSFDELWPALKRLAREVEMLRPALFSPLPPQNVQVAPTGNGVQHLLRRAGTRYYLLAVNPLPRSVGTTVKLGGEIGGAGIRLLFSGRRIGAKGGSFRFRFGPYQREVFVFDRS